MSTLLPTIDTLPQRPSPSGLPTVHITSRDHGASGHFVAMQWLAPGERVFRHVHTVEETLLFLEGSGAVTLGNRHFDIQRGSSLFIPAGERHGFAASDQEGLCVIVVFPVPYFADTIFTGEDGLPELSQSGKASY